MLADAVPPFPMTAASGLRETRVGQTVWCCVEASNAGAVDAFLVVRPFFQMPMPEFRAGVLASPVKRLDVVGAPSPAGTCISEMLGEVWRFWVPAGETRRYAFFAPAEGMYLYHAAWATDALGVAIPVLGAVTGIFWSAVGAAHALTVSSIEGPSQ